MKQTIGFRKVLSDPYYFMAYGFGSGLSPRAPGTVGSLAAVPVYLLLSSLPVWAYLTAVVIALAVGIVVCDRVSRDLAIKDPASVVWDEFVGLWITLLMLPEGWYWLPAGFLIFRFFDILKPWPVSYLDRELKGGAGIMLDDVAAGLMGFATLQIVAWWIGS